MPRSKSRECRDKPAKQATGTHSELQEIRPKANKNAVKRCSEDGKENWSDMVHIPECRSQQRDLENNSSACTFGQPPDTSYMCVEVLNRATQSAVTVEAIHSNNSINVTVTSHVTYHMTQSNRLNARIARNQHTLRRTKLQASSSQCILVQEYKSHYGARLATEDLQQRRYECRTSMYQAMCTDAAGP